LASRPKTGALRGKSQLYQNLNNMNERNNKTGNEFGIGLENHNRVKTPNPRSASQNRHAHPEAANSMVGENNVAYDGHSGARAFTFL
jgi:hypothetical protein